MFTMYLRTQETMLMMYLMTQKTSTTNNYVREDFSTNLSNVSNVIKKKKVDDVSN
jgi:hypothetical protein